MKAKNIECFVLIAAFLFVLSGCNSAPRKSDNSAEIDSHYTITTNEDLTYSYKIIAKNGDVLFSDDHSPKEPHIDQVSNNILSVTIQTGLGRSTNWAVFCDVEKGKTSTTYQYVLGAQDNYVFYVELKDGRHNLVVQDIFDSKNYRKTYALQNCEAFADPSCELTFEGKGKAIITYLSGTETAISQTNTTIYFP